MISNQNQVNCYILQPDRILKPSVVLSEEFKCQEPLEKAYIVLELQCSDVSRFHFTRILYIQNEN
jgi:hypothetical protein